MTRNRTSQPNILVILSDQQHWAALGSLDETFHTPHLDRFAWNSMRFSHAFCTTPQCSPSRSSLLTGLYPHETGVMGNVGAAGGGILRHKTIAAGLRDAGYRTAFFGKWHLGRHPAAVAGWDEEQGITCDGKLRDGQKILQYALDFLNRQRDAKQPFALFLSFNQPHGIYQFDKYADPMPKTDPGLPRSWHEKDLDTVPSIQRTFMERDQGKVIVNAPETEWKRYRRVYRKQVSDYDALVGKVLDHARELDQFAETLVVVTSDHGDMDCNHRLIFKGPFFYDHLVAVPLFIKPPASCPFPAPGGVSDFMSVNCDLPATLADFAGCGFHTPHGQSLAPFLTGRAAEQPERDFVISQYFSKQQWVNPARMIRTRNFKYNRYLSTGEELYDLRNDPDELQNLADHALVRPLKDELSGLLDRWMAENNDPFHSLESAARKI